MNCFILEKLRMVAWPCSSGGMDSFMQ